MVLRSLKTFHNIIHISCASAVLWKGYIGIEMVAPYASCCWPWPLHLVSWPLHLVLVIFPFFQLVQTFHLHRWWLSPVATLCFFIQPLAQILDLHSWWSSPATFVRAHHSPYQPSPHATCTDCCISLCRAGGTGPAAPVLAGLIFQAPAIFF